MNFHKLANDISKEEITDWSLKDRLEELVNFRKYLADYYDSYSDEYNSFLKRVENETDLEEKFILEYDFKKEVLSKDYDLDGLNFLLVTILHKYNLTIDDYNTHINLLKEKHDLELKANWEHIASKEDLDLVESISLINYIQRQDYWDYEHMPLSYAIFDKTIDNILESVENNIDNENMELLEIFLK
ncbi:MAG: hypothetical protein IJH35_06750 [Methanobrevibacter sp.]|nr:hypothetical protein [Methanobrevibacter sp.]